MAPVSAIPLSALSPLGILPDICTSALVKLSSLGVTTGLSDDAVIFEFSDTNRGSAECWSCDTMDGLVRARSIEETAASDVSCGRLSPIKGLYDGFV